MNSKLWYRSGEVNDPNDWVKFLCLSGSFQGMLSKIWKGKTVFLDCRSLKIIFQKISCSFWQIAQKEFKKIRRSSEYVSGVCQLESFALGWTDKEPAITFGQPQISDKKDFALGS